MKQLKKYTYILLLLCLSLVTACEDLKFGDDFLHKPPSNDVTIDTVFSRAEYARRVLWYSYNKLPYGFSTGNYNTVMRMGNIEGLTDLCQTKSADSGLLAIYYPGQYNAGNENKGDNTKFYATKFRFYALNTWEGIRHAWLFYENVDRVPDMPEEEKMRMKAEAKTLIAIYYANMLRHYGGMPIVDHSLRADELVFPKRSTLQETVDFIVGLLNEAIECNEFPWALPENEQSNWDGRMTKASAMGLKVRVLLFAASPLFNNEQPYFEGETSSSLLTWFGDYKKERWQDALKAGEDFFRMMEQQPFYGLVKKENTKTGTYRQAFQDAYFTRGTTESLISVRRDYYKTTDLSSLDQSIRWGAYNPTKEYFDMFQMADGTDFDWKNSQHRKNPFINRDPRMNETIILDGDDFQGGKVQAYQKKVGDVANYPDGKDWGKNKLDAASLATGITVRKFGLDRKGEYNGRVFHWSHLRLAEIYLSYAEALNEFNGGPNTLAYDCVNTVRNRVGMGDLKTGLNQKAFREAVLRERACEFGWEEVRFFDLIRWKREDIFTKKLHGLKIYKHKTTGEYQFDEWQLDERAWQKTNGFSPKWYLSAFPSAEIDKGYGLIQNPGW